MKLKLIGFIFPLAWVIQIHAADGGSTAGDGGFSVNCLTSEGQNETRLLDTYEFEILYQTTSFLPVVSEVEGLALLQARMRESLPVGHRATHAFTRAERFLEQALTIEDQSEYPSDGLDSAPPHELWVEIPHFCKITRIATRNMKLQPYLIIVHKKHWLRLSVADRVGLIVHEAFHELFKREDLKSKLRLAVGYLLAPSEFRRKNRHAFRLLFDSPQKFVGFQN